ncbi:MAG: extracellular solute-binding protein [Chloroflexi bacterium]|nr:extracellular solute-binding protein [Chloroflexota bacterium]
MKKSRLFIMFSLLIIAGMLMVACGGGGEETAVEEPQSADTEESSAEEPVAEEPAAEEPAEEAAAEEEAPAEEASGDKVQIRWFVGLGAGSDEPMFAPQEKIVEDFNASHDDVELVLEIVDADQAYSTLATQIAAGNAPDIVGPVGIRGRDFFRGAWLDLSDLLTANSYDLSDFDPGLVQFYVDKTEGQLGLPFAIFPSFLSFNKELFDEAGIPYPPQEYGASYTDIDGNEGEWNIETMTEVAKMLTVDANGNDVTSLEFDPDSIEQWGYGEQWTDFRGAATLFGSGSLVDDDGNAQVPEHWREAAKWFQNSMWTDYFYPSGPYAESDILGAGNWFESGNVAMAHTHLWYLGCCIGNIDFEWDTAAVPAYDGAITAKMHADTFAIMKGSEHPEEAFVVLDYFLGEKAEEMTTMYGGMPARLSLQDVYFDTFGDTVPGGEDINWQVVVDSMAYADNPNHESYMPSPQEANERYNEFWTKVGEEPGLDLEAELDLLVTDLQAIYDAAGNE